MNIIYKKTGFTLVELLVVISIIAVLVAATTSSFVNSQKKSRDASRKSELKSLSNALNMYYADNGVFPASVTFGGELVDNGIIYMKKLPDEVRASFGIKQFKYVVSGTRKSFRLYTNLENSDDGDCETSCLSSEYTVSNGCCYVITSSNVGVTDTLN